MRKQMKMNHRVVVYCNAKTRRKLVSKLSFPRWILIKNASA